MKDPPNVVPGLSQSSETPDEPRPTKDSNPHRGPIELPPLLSRCATDAAARWANRIRAKTLSEKRRTSGGWPGTLSEARYVVAEELLPSLGIECLPELGLVDREEVVRFLYRSARTWWNQRKERDVEDLV